MVAKTNKGLYGDWTAMKAVPRGFLACGARLKYEGSQGKDDDTAGNGLDLAHCAINNWHDQGNTPIWKGDWGSWDSMKYCPKYQYMVSMLVRMEPNQRGGDDTALNGLKIKCANLNYDD